MQERLDRIVGRIKKDLNPEKLDIQDTKSGENIKLLAGDSCVRIDKDGNITLRLSKKNLKSAFPALAFLLQLTGKTHNKNLIDTLEHYEEYCDMQEEKEELLQEKEDEEDPLAGIIHLLESSVQEQIDKKKEHIQVLDEDIASIIESKKLKSVVQAMYVPKGEFEAEMFEELPTVPGVANLKLIIEEED